MEKKFGGKHAAPKMGAAARNPRDNAYQSTVRLQQVPQGGKAPDPAASGKKTESFASVPAGGSGHGAYRSATAYQPVSGSAPQPAWESGGSIEVKKNRKLAKRLGMGAGIFLGLLLVVYLIGAFVFTGRFFPSTVVSNFDISMKTPDEASAILDEAVGDYKFSVTGQGLDLSLSAEQIGMTLDSAAISSGMMKDVNPWAWPVEVFMQHDETESMVATCGSEKLIEAIAPEVDLVNAAAIQPVNATIAYDEARLAYAVVPEVEGTALDLNKVADQVKEGVKTLSPKINVTKDATLSPTVFKDDERLAVAVDEANVMIKADLEIMMEGNLVTEVTPSLISSWITVSPDVTVTFDDAGFTAWVDQVAAGCNTVGTERAYTRLDGKEITVSGGVYGWEIDSDALRTAVTDAVMAGTVGTIDVPVLQNGVGFTKLGSRDWGNRYCDIDLSEQHAYFYDDAGALVWETDIVTGAPGEHATPTGVWQATWGKESPSMLIGEKDPETGEPEYKTEVKYWMPFIGNSIGLHDATWQTSFGGTRYKDGFGSHGCVNISLDAAAALYDIIKPAGMSSWFIGDAMRRLSCSASMSATSIAQ